VAVVEYTQFIQPPILDASQSHPIVEPYSPN
jgi:hypothetical protein